MSPLVIGGLGTTELLIILAVLVLLFGATKLPELARGSGRALRIFKAETKGLMDDEDEGMKTPEQLEVDKRHEAEQRAAELEAEAERLRRGETA
jgi:sec-independent protein translocase protein TatA